MKWTLGFLALATLSAPGDVHTQLRPLDPVDWSLVEAAAGGRVGLGTALLDRQRASLAGLEGRLWEVGLVDVAWRTGRVVLEASGTLYRVLEAEHSFLPPCCGVEERQTRSHRDAGDFRIATTLHITRREALRTALRFGTRLPTTDNRVGLERDQTDFFALLAAQTRLRGVALAAEAGLGIHGTREEQYEQSDVLLYALEVRRRFGAFEPSLALVGQVDGLSGRTVRGNEDLQEARLGLRAGSSRWLDVRLVRGFREFSPRTGVSLGVGAHW